MSFQKNDIYMGIEISRGYANIGVYDIDKNDILVVDNSGGYGKVSFPTPIHYIKNSQEWIFGENAIDNDIYEDTIVFKDILDIIYHEKGFVDIDNNPFNIATILSFFLNELLQNIYNINPNSNIKSIAVYYEKQNEVNINYIFIEALKMLDVAENIVNFIDLNEAIISSITNFEKESNNISFFYLGSQHSYFAKIENISEKLYKENITTSNDLDSLQIDNALYNMFLKIYQEKNDISDQAKWKIKSMVYHNKDLICNKFANNQNAKIYFNFCYPAFEYVLNIDDLKKIFSEYTENIDAFLKKFVEKDENVFVCGKCLEYEFFKKNLSYKLKNISLIKGITYYSAFSDAKDSFKIINNSTIKNDIGVFIKKNDKLVFYPIISKGTLKEKSEKICSFYISENMNQLSLVEKNESEYSKLIDIQLTDIIGNCEISRIKLILNYKKDHEIELTIIDEGFGEIFPKNKNFKLHKVITTN